MELLDIIITFVFLISILLGIWRGLIYEFLMLISLIISIYLTIFITPLTKFIWQNFIDENYYSLVSKFSYSIVFAVLLYLCNFIVSLIRKKIPKIGIKTADRFLGSLFGLFRGFLLVSILAFIIRLSPFDNSNWWKNSFTGGQLSPFLVDKITPLLPSFK